MNSDQTRNISTSAVNEDNNNGLHSDVTTTGHQVSNEVTNDRDGTTSDCAVLETDNVIFQTKSKQVAVLTSTSTDTSSNPASAIIQEQTAATSMS